MSETALIANIQGYSIHDGPGIRTVAPGSLLAEENPPEPQVLSPVVRT